MRSREVDGETAGGKGPLGEGLDLGSLSSKVSTGEVAS